MFKNVLVGVDGSTYGRDAIALASQLAGPGGKLTLAHVHAGELHPLHAITPGLLAEEQQASLQLLERERAGSRRAGRAGRASSRRARARACTARPRSRARTCWSSARAATALRPGDARRRHARGAQRRALRGRDRRPRLRRAGGQSDHEGGSRLQRLAGERAGAGDGQGGGAADAREHRGPGSRLDTELRFHRPDGALDRRQHRPDDHRSERPHEPAARRRGSRRVRAPGRGAGGVRRGRGPAGRRLARLRPGAAPGAGQHLRLPGAPRTLLAARAAPPGGRRRR